MICKKDSKSTEHELILLIHKKAAAITVKYQIVAGAIICFNHLTDQAFIWEQAAIWDRRLIPSSQKSCSTKLVKYGIQILLINTTTTFTVLN